MSDTNETGHEGTATSRSYARGGIVKPTGKYLVGEAGAECLHNCDLPEADEERQTFDCPICGRHWSVGLEWGHLYVTDDSMGESREWRPDKDSNL